MPISVPDVAFSDERLANGLRVIVAEDHLAPVVAVNLWYDVGSKHESAGQDRLRPPLRARDVPGLAPRAKAEHIALIQAAGGTMNGTTWLDRTNYFETLPAHQLDLALWLEADRMATLLDALSQENLDNQREVVKNEKRWSYDNRPYGSWQEKLQAHLFPPEHPYHHSTIGSMDDLDAASLEDVSAFFRTYYAPNNAVLSIVGDVETADVLAAAERYFGAIPANPAIPPLGDLSLPPTLGGERRETVHDRVPLPRVHVGFRAPVFGDPRLDALDLAGQILAGGKGSRLNRRLVRDERIAQDVALFTLGFVGGASISAGWATVRPGVAVARSRPRFHEELERLTTEPVSDDELARANALTEADELGALQRVEERADRLSMYATLFDDPGLINRMLPRYLAVTPEAIRDVAAGRLPAGQPAGADLPAGGPPADDVALSPETPRRRDATTRRWRHEHDRRSASRRPGHRRAATARARRARTSSPPWRAPARRTACDPRRRPARPTAGVGLDGRPGGAAEEPAERAGATVLAARALTEGTERYDAIGLIEATERLGASLHAEAGWDAMSVGRRRPGRPARAGPRAAGRGPAPADVPGDRGRPPARRASQRPAAGPGRSAPARRGGLRRHHLRTESPYHRPSGGTRETVEGLAAADAPTRLRRGARPPPGDAHRRRRPRRPGRRRRSPSGSSARGRRAPDAASRPRSDRGHRGRPAAAGPRHPSAGSVQTEIRIGHRGLPRRIPDFHAVSVMSAILGGLFNSRLNMKLREEKGYTYGAGAGFDLRRGAGPFAARAAVNTEVTVPAIIDTLAELTRMRDEPVERGRVGRRPRLPDRRLPAPVRDRRRRRRCAGGLAVHGLASRS